MKLIYQIILRERNKTVEFSGDSGAAICDEFNQRAIRWAKYRVY